MPKRRILIVEDHRAVSQFLLAGLETMGEEFEIQAVPSGEEAMLLLSSQEVELMVVDVRLPGITGFELIKKAQALVPGLKYILITGVEDPNVRREVANAGAEAFFFKPIELSEFLDSVQSSLRNREEMIVPSFESTIVRGIAECLSELRQKFKATAVALFSDQGEIVAQAGELPKQVRDPRILMSLLTISNTATNLSDQLGTSQPEGQAYIAGRDFGLFLAHVKRGMMILAAIENSGIKTSDSSQVLTELTRTAGKLKTILEKMGLPSSLESETETQNSESRETVWDEESIKELSQILDKAGKKKARSEDIDAFWDDLTDVPLENTIRKDALTYDQARKLGLAPEE